jgi:alkanesulfonate monooxygenase SsuD/methylene tetrahydromethanopterin reductase-like flavin-dependent oxidoreductase (luciferase family)
VLAKIAATLDVLSKGRLFMGIGAAWNKPESIAYGITFPTIKERLLRLEETIQIIRKMWTEEPSASFVGKYYQIQNAYCNPKPIQKPSPSIMIGGSGEQTLKVVAKYANACNLSGSPEIVKRKLNILKDHCKSVGRDYDSILKTGLYYIVINEDKEIIERSIQKNMEESKDMFKDVKKAQAIYETSEYLLRHEEDVKKAQAIYGTPEAVLKQMLLLEEAGIQYFIVNLEASRELDALDIFVKDIMKKFS